MGNSQEVNNVGQKCLYNKKIEEKTTKDPKAVSLLRMCLVLRLLLWFGLKKVVL
jgi:hypothetical protein